MTGKLEATSDVRSVPLGQKRRKGRPKKLPNCLQKSPTRSQAVQETVTLDEHVLIGSVGDSLVPVLDDHVPDDPVGDVLVPDHVPGVQKRRKRCPVSDSPIGTLAKQAQPGLGQSKPPKKKPRTQEVGTQKPPVLNCKKRKGSCNHEVIFGTEHYNKILWDKYAATVKAKKSIVEIDPDYVC